MRAYSTYRLIEFPDVADIKNEARRSCVGRNDSRGYIRDKRRKRSIRRYIKRADRARGIAAEMRAEA